MICCFDKTCSTTSVIWLTAILCTRLVAASNQTLNFSSPVLRDHYLEEQFNLEALNESTITIREMQALIRKEKGKNGLPVECCPTTEDMIEPLGGVNLDGHYVELYRDGEHVQRFFEYSCRPDVLDKPCRFVDRKLQAQSRCVQKYSYSYALVKTKQQQRQLSVFPGIGGTASWMLNYVRVRSGCSCQLSPKPRKSSVPKKVQ